MQAPVVWPTAACGALHQATRRGDALSVVALIRRFGVVGPLQLIGDGLLVALEARPADAAPLRDAVVELLAARGWDGDEVLVDALCGRSDPALRRVHLDLAELAALLDADPESGEIGVDLASGEVRLESWSDATAARPDMVWLTPGSLGGWGDTARFAASLPEGPLRERFVEALTDREHGLQRFQALISADVGLERAWVASRSERLLGRSRHWLMTEGVLALPRSEQ